METVPQSRRTFITKVALLLVSVPLLWRYLTPAAKPRRRVMLTVARADVPPLGALVYREERVALIHAESGYYALSLVCTHLGCTLNMDTGRLSCPCHGSEFDRGGKVLTGPAERPLQRLQVEVHGGMIEVLDA